MIRFLKTNFRKYGADFQQIYRNSQFAVYSVSREGYGFKNEPIKVVNYEVFEVRQLPVNEHMKQYEAFKGFDAYEPYPADEAFGDWAWSCSSKDSLKRILKEQFGVSQLPFQC